MERAGEEADKLVEKLLDAPSRPLDNEQREVVYGFEAGLYDHEVVDGERISDIIKNHKAEEGISPLVFAEAFKSGAATQLVAEMGQEVPAFESHNDVYGWFAQLVGDKKLSTDQLNQLAKFSIDYYKSHMVDALIAGTEPDPAILDVRSIVLDPERTITLAGQTLKARQFLLELRETYKKNDPDDVEAAKRAVIDVYLGKINTLITSDFASLLYVHDQADAAGDGELSQRAVDAMLPSIQSASDNPVMRSRLLQRFDYISNGMGLDEDGHASPITDILLKNAGIIDAEQRDAVFTPEETEVLKQTMLSPETMQRIFTNVIAKAGLLSSEDPSTWSTTRKERAADGLWQVVIHPTKNSFSVSGISGAYMTPNEARSIYDVDVVGGFHELQHINQCEADLEIGKTFKLCNVKGRRVSMLREGGANLVQRQAERRFFGKSKPIGSLTYARALQVMQRGGSLAEAARAFFDEKVRLEGGSFDDRKLANEAADRVLRFKRQYSSNSAPLSYAEEAVFMHELSGESPEAQQRATAITSLDLVDQVRLHKFGLLPEVGNSSKDWTELIAEELRPYIEEALGSLSDN